MNKLPVLVGTVLLIGFSYANAQTHAYPHDGHGRGGIIPPRAAHTEVHAVPAVALVHDSHASYGHGAAVREPHRESRHGMEHGRREHERRAWREAHRESRHDMDHGRREHERRHHNPHTYGPRGH